MILNQFDKITASHISQMEKLNHEQKAALEKEDYENYYKLNLNFHNIFNTLSDNKALMHLITPFKQRLYDFPRRGYIKEWEMNNCDEHHQFIELVKKKDREGAARIMRDVHWSYAVQEKNLQNTGRYQCRLHDCLVQVRPPQPGPCVPSGEILPSPRQHRLDYAEHGPFQGPSRRHRAHR